MGLERLSLLIMDDVIEAHHRAADDAWHAMHRRADAMPLPPGPDDVRLGTALAEAVDSLVLRITRGTRGAPPVPGPSRPDHGCTESADAMAAATRG